MCEPVVFRALCSTHCNVAGSADSWAATKAVSSALGKLQKRVRGDIGYQEPQAVAPWPKREPAVGGGEMSLKGHFSQSSSAMTARGPLLPVEAARRGTTHCSPACKQKRNAMLKHTVNTAAKLP